MLPYGLLTGVTATVPPSDYHNHTISALFANTNAPQDYWYSGITVKGWGDEYRTWQLVGNSADTDSGQDLFYRYGRNSTWSSWQKILTSNNWSNYCAAASHTHDDLIVHKTLSSTQTNSTTNYLLYTFTTTSATSYCITNFDMDICDFESGLSNAFNVKIGGRIDNSSEGSNAIRKMNSIHSTSNNKNVKINIVKNSDSWTWYVYLTVAGSWRTPEIWFKFTRLSGLTKTWSGAQVSSLQGTTVWESSNVWGSSLPTSYLTEGMMFYKLT